VYGSVRWLQAAMAAAVQPPRDPIGQYRAFRPATVTSPAGEIQTAERILNPHFIRAAK